MRIAAVVSGLVLLAVNQLWAQRREVDTLAPAVVQRFVDAANARDVPGMMATVASEAVFSVLPSGEILGAGRDSIRAFYTGRFARLDPGLLVHVTSRIRDGSFVVDHEVFRQRGARAPSGQATWVYRVTGGLIRNAWTLKPPKAP